MSDTNISIASISSQKLAEVGQKAEVAVFRKALDQQESVAKLLIEGATSTPPPGKGTNLNIVA